MKSPVVSVVIPVFNSQSFIRETILSVAHQTLDDIELIIINDGSTDETCRVVIDTLEELQDNRISFISRENRGVSRTLNEGLRISHGEYFSYVGADDIWDERKLEIQVAELERTGLDAAFSDSWVINENGELMSRYGSQYPYRGGNIYLDIVWGKFQPPSTTVLFRRSFLEALGGFNEGHIAEDRDLWIRIARDHEIAYIDEPLGYYRIHQTNSSSNLEHTYQYSRQVLDSTLHDDPSLHPWRRQLEAKLDAFQSAAYYEKLRLREARRFAMKALVQNPAEVLAWRTLLFSLPGKRVIESIRSRQRRKIANRDLE